MFESNRISGKNVPGQKKKEMFLGIECEISFYLFTKQNWIRIIIHKMTEHWFFEGVVQFLIMLSSIKLAFDTYDSSEAITNISSNVDYFFNFFFIFESLVKSINQGFIQEKGSYLRENWNQLDFFIVSASVFDMLV